MIVCRKCSRRHPDGTDFCACGAFLEFDGEHVAGDPPAATPASSHPADVAPPDRTDDVPGQSATWGTAPGGGSHDVATTGSSPASQLDAPRTPAAEPAPWSGFEQPGTAAAATGSWVTAQLPDVPVAPVRPDAVDVRPTIRPGDVVCAACGTANPPTRQFCQKCGGELSAQSAAVAVAGSGQTPRRRRRVLSALRRAGIPTDPDRLAAEAHVLSRGGMSGRTVLFRTGGVAVLLGGMLAFLGPWRSTVTAWARDRLGASRFEVVDVDAEQIESVASDPLVAPVVFPLQDAGRAVDGYLNTSWATRWLDPSGSGVEEAPADATCQETERTDSLLRVTFPSPTDIARLSVVAGRYDGDESRGRYVRPRVLELRWIDEEAASTTSDEGGATDDGARCRYLDLADTGELSVHTFEVSDLVSLEIRVVAVYADPESVPTVDIAEIAFERDR